MVWRQWPDLANSRGVQDRGIPTKSRKGAGVSRRKVHRPSRPFRVSTSLAGNRRLSLRTNLEGERTFQLVPFLGDGRPLLACRLHVRTSKIFSGAQLAPMVRRSGN